MKRDMKNRTYHEAGGKLLNIRRKNVLNNRSFDCYKNAWLPMKVLDPLGCCDFERQSKLSTTFWDCLFWPSVRGAVMSQLLFFLIVGLFRYLYIQIIITFNIELMNV